MGMDFTQIKKNTQPLVFPTVYWHIVELLLKRQLSQPNETIQLESLPGRWFTIQELLPRQVPAISVAETEVWSGGGVLGRRWVCAGGLGSFRGEIGVNREIGFRAFGSNLGLSTWGNNNMGKCSIRLRIRLRHDNFY